MSDSKPSQCTQYLIGKFSKEMVPGSSRIKALAGISEGRSDVNELGPRGISKNMEGRNCLRPRIMRFDVCSNGTSFCTYMAIQKPYYIRA